MARRRKIKHLKTAKLLEGKPEFIPTVNHRGVRKAGLTFEAQVAKKLALLYGDENVLWNPWICYLDERGRGWCCPDIIILNDPLVVVECKLTITEAAEKKLFNIYKPCVEYLWPDHKIKLVQIAKNLRRDWCGPLIKNLKDCYHMDDEFASHIWRK